MSDQIQEKPAFWGTVSISDTVKKNGKMLTAFLAILIGFNLFLYSRLSPTAIQSVYSGRYQNDFDTPIDFEAEGWYDLEGKWVFKDGQLTHTDFLATNPALVIPLKANPTETVYFSADLKIDANHDAGGLRFNMWSPKQIARSHRVAIVRQGTKSVLIGGYYVDSLDFMNQFSLPLDRSFEENPTATLTIVSTESKYDVYLNGAPMVEDIPTFNPLGWHGFSAIGDSVQFDRVNIQVAAGADQQLLAQFLNGKKPHSSTEDTSHASIPTDQTDQTDGISLIEPADGNLEGLGWQAVIGTWSERNGAIIQSDSEQADARLIYHQSLAAYQLEIDLRHLDAPGGGVLFGLEQPNSLNNGYMARFTDDGTGFFYGRFNSVGEFEGASFHPTPPSNEKIDSIRISNDGSQFTVSLNGEVIFQDLPHSGPPTFVGLLSNKAEVVFDRAILSSFIDTPANQTEATSESNNLFTDDLAIFSGDWVAAENRSITQSNPERVDHIVQLNRSAKQFTFETTITMKNDPSLPDIGGGIIFNMPSPDSPNGGQIVRFLNGGSEVIWGYFNETGQFIGQSGREINLTTGNPHNLSVTVNGSTFDVIVNGETVATGLPLQQPEGWLGLITFSGPVTFDQFSLNGESP